MKRQLLAVVVLCCLMQSPAAYAYIGPGLAASTIGVVIGVVVSIFLAIFAVFWYPIKRLYKRLFPTKVENTDSNDEHLS